MTAENYSATRKPFSFYRPHRRELYQLDTNFRTDLRTGELKACPSKTKQSFVAECDINNILKQYSKTGMIRHMSAQAEQGAYRDLPDDLDFQNALNTVMQGQQAFATLPSSVRSRFHNDPAEFLEFMADPGNQDEAIKLGLATDSRSPAPPPAPPEGNGGAGGIPPADAQKPA